MKRTKKTVVDPGGWAHARKVKMQAGRANPILMAFASWFRQWRQEQKLTLSQVGSDLGLSVGAISEWESCINFPSVSALQAVVEYTGMPVWVILRPKKVGSPSRSAGSARTRRAKRH